MSNRYTGSGFLAASDNGSPNGPKEMNPPAPKGPSHADRLGKSGFGHLSSAGADGPMIFPVNYFFVGGLIIIWADPGTSLLDCSLSKVAFEVDQIRSTAGESWSVVVEGWALDISGGFETLFEPLRLNTPAARRIRDQSQCIAILPSQITGREIARPTRRSPVTRPYVPASAGNRTIHKSPTGAAAGELTPRTHFCRAPHGTRRIAVGVDGSPGSIGALEWASSEAKTRGTALEVVHVWHNRTNTYGYFADQAFIARESDEKENLDKIIVDTLGIKPEVDIYEVVQDGPFASTLAEVADGAELLVVGGKGHHGLAGAVTGSVGDRVRRIATCPVVVVPAVGST